METKFDNSFNYYDFASLKQLKSDSQVNKEEQLKVIASQLESVFLQLVMKNMQDANEAFKSDLYGRQQEDFYQDMLNQQMALSLSKAGGIGLADMILKQLQGTMPNGLPVQKTVELTPFITAKQPKNSQEKGIVKKDPVVSEPEVKSTANTDINNYVKSVLPFAKQVAKIIGIDPKLLVAQSALETGWGKHVIQNANNFFGIKAKGAENKVAAETTEYVNKQPVREVAEFKSYATMLESFLDYVSLLQTKRYEKALANANDPKAFLTELQNAGYATDPDYANKVLAIYENHPSLNEV
ncbi:MAG: flagellar assembly peptidoglycan hydrolase FlgJ [Candidatus Berkiella sp.]